MNNNEQLDVRAALITYAQAINNLDPGPLIDLVADDLKYTSQWVFDQITNKADFAHYITGKLQTVARTGSVVRAELARVGAEAGHWYYEPFQPCVVLEQDGELMSTVLIEVAKGKITSIDLCCIPGPETCLRSGEYPR